MNQKDLFKKSVSEDAAMAQLMKHVDREYYRDEHRGDLNPAIYMIMYPALHYLLVNIGLPWVVALKELSDFQITKLRAWIKEEYAKIPGDPERVAPAAETFYGDLAALKDEVEQARWEKLVELLNTSAG